MSLWFHRIDSYKWINGSIREDLEPDERSVWADLLALAGLTREERREQGFIERSEGIPYKKQAILAMLNVPEELYDRTIDKCVKEGRLIVYEDGTLQLANWNNYNDTSSQAEKRYRRQMAAAKAQDTKRLKEASIDRLAWAVNELNRNLGKDTYIINNGAICNKNTGEIIEGGE